MQWRLLARIEGEIRVFDVACDESRALKRVLGDPLHQTLKLLLTRGRDGHEPQATLARPRARRRNGAGRVLYIEDYEYYLDSDQDGMPAGWEEKYGSSDHSFDDFTRDSDGDGISDRDEFVLITSPIDADTDGDELPDQWELMASLDPTDPSDAGTDIDGDGYSALEEFRAGTDPLNRESKPNSSSSGPEQGGSGDGGSIGLSLAVLVLCACFGRTVRRRESAVTGSVTSPRSIAPSASA